MFDSYRVSCTACREQYIISGTGRPLFCPAGGSILKNKFIMRDE